MKNNNKYPKVLIIYHSRINKADQYGVSIRGWLDEWPKENLAQIYSGGEVGEETFFGYNFKLGHNERRFGKLFFKLKGSSIGQSSYSIELNQERSKLDKHSFWSLLKHKFGKWLICTGLWELIFKPKFSQEMIKFIEDFNPQVIYCQGYVLTFAWLPVMIHEKFKIPICFQTGDDWPAYLYRDSPLSFAIRPIVRRAVKMLLAKSSARLANGNKMAKEYFEKYGMSFETMMMCDSLSRFSKAVSQRVVNNDTISILYVGRLGHYRWVSIVDLCKAAELLNNEGYKIKVTIFATVIPPEAINTLTKLNNLQILPGPSHEELPSYLKGGDILYLPETFDPMEADSIRLSLSTKAHLYMMSEKPILVYSSPVTGIMNYAKEEGWACIVQEQNINKLKQALHNLIVNHEYRKELINKGVKVALKNHDEDKVRARFLTILKQLIY